MDRREGDGDHAELASLLAGEDLAVAVEPESAGPGVFDVEPDADPGAVFPQSVASGGPTPTGVALWTRVAPDAFDPDRPLAVEVADDPAFEDVVYRGVVEDRSAVAVHDHTVKVDLDGALAPDRRYHYRFVHDGTASRRGRCRTLPAPDDSPDSLSLAVLTCQNYLNGYYGAYGHVAEEDVDFLLHVGDFIYESDAGHFLGVGSRSYEGRDLDLPSGHDRVRTLSDYRYLYRTYRSDPLLQRALRRHTLIAAWDDHEIANDVHWDYEADAPAADHPRGDDPEFMTRLAADALHAWWEYMPARIGYDPDAEDLQDRFTLWRSMAFGDLVDLVMTDERLYREVPRPVRLPTRRATAPAGEPLDRTMLGPDQRAWFLRQVRESEATWTVWSDEVLTIPLRLGAGPASLYPVQGGWDGYKRERQRIFERLAAWDVDNFVTLTGDMHSYVAGYQQTAYRDPLTGAVEPRDADGVRRIGVEFMTPAVTSLNVAEALGVNRGPLAGPTRRLLSWLVRAMNPHVEFFDSHRWGYSVVEFTREACTYTAYSVDKTRNAPDADRELVVALRVPESSVAIEDVTEATRAAMADAGGERSSPAEVDAEPAGEVDDDAPAEREAAAAGGRDGSAPDDRDGGTPADQEDVGEPATVDAGGGDEEPPAED